MNWTARKSFIELLKELNYPVVSLWVVPEIKIYILP